MPATRLMPRTIAVESLFGGNQPVLSGIFLEFAYGPPMVLSATPKEKLAGILPGRRYAGSVPLTCRKPGNPAPAKGDLLKLHSPSARGDHVLPLKRSEVAAGLGTIAWEGIDLPTEP
jgi:hypothetical protein